MIRYILLIYVLFLSSCSSINKKVEIYYLPFEKWTYAPVTIKNIEKRSSYYGKIDSENMKFNNFLKHLKMSKTISKINSKFIRLKIILPNNEIIYMDKSHTFIFNHKIRIMDEQPLNELNEILNKYTMKKK